MSYRAGIVSLLAVLALFFGRGAFAACDYQTGVQYFNSATDANNQWVACGSYAYGCPTGQNPNPLKYGELYDVFGVNGVWKDACYLYPKSASDACPTGQTMDRTTGACVTPPPPVDCAGRKGKEAIGTLTGAHMPDGTFCANVVDSYYPNGPNANWSTTSGSCTAVMSVSIESGDASKGAYRYVYTGETCSTNPVGTPSPPDSSGQPTFPSNGCITGSAGDTVCLDTSKAQNCGSVNGTDVCVDKVPAGNCTFLAGGNWACASTAASPPKPTVAPSASMVGHTANGSEGTVLIFPRGATGGDPNSTYTGAGTGTTGTPCGTATTPCKIDETGTPTVSDADFAAAKGTLDGAVTSAQGEGDGPQGDGSGTASGARSAIDSALPSGGDCSPLVMALPGGREVVIDLADKCSDFRAALAWMLGIATAWFVLDLLFRGPS